LQHLHVILGTDTFRIYCHVLFTCRAEVKRTLFLPSQRRYTVTERLLEVLLWCFWSELCCLFVECLWKRRPSYDGVLCCVLQRDVLAWCTRLKWLAAQ